MSEFEQLPGQPAPAIIVGMDRAGSRAVAAPVPAGLLVESDARNVVLARRAGARQGLPAAGGRRADAGLMAGFSDLLPADAMLPCGIFGNVSDRDAWRTVQEAPALCRAGATVIWTRHHRPPDLTPRIRAWFASAGFREIASGASRPAP